MPESPQAFEKKIKDALKDDVLASNITCGGVSISVARDNLVKVMTFLRDGTDFQFRVLIDICGVDYPQRVPRFDVVYHLLSMVKNQRLCLKVQVEEGQSVPTTTGVFPAANWAERETWDMYGIPFSGHPDLRRLLTDYNFEGHPLRKDFPLTGYVEVRYDNEQKRVVYEPVNLPQEFRTFDFLSPWEGATPAAPPDLPGDEKANPISANDSFEERKQDVGT